MSLVESFTPLRKQKDASSEVGKAIFTLSESLHSDQLRSRYGIEVEGNDVPAPIQYINDIPLPSQCLKFLQERKNIHKLTPVQMQGISCLLKNRDCVCLSPTGTGKTYSYLLPMCSIFWKTKMVDGTVGGQFCLIIVPTRELMNQVLNTTIELVDLLIPKQGTSRPAFDFAGNSGNNYTPYHNHTPYNQTPYNQTPHNNHTPYYNGDLNQRWESNFSHMLPHCPPPYNQIVSSYRQTSADFKTHTVVGLCGGVPINQNVAQLAPQTKIIIATPGRLLDLCDRGHLSLENISYFVIDECDKMLEMGLEESLRKIVAMVTVHDSTVLTSLWSATLPTSLERLARSAVINPVFICTGIRDTVPRNIIQNVVFLHTYLKPNTLLEVLRQTPYPPVIVFTSSKHKADEIAELLQSEQFHAAAIHSEKKQSCRTEVMEAFRTDELDVLVATDLISRGLDLPAVTHVINFDTPDCIEDYVHRCGRTGRFGRPGTATTFLTLNCKIAEEIKNMLESTGSVVPHELTDTKMFGKEIVITDMGDRVK